MRGNELAFDARDWRHPNIVYGLGRGARGADLPGNGAGSAAAPWLSGWGASLSCRARRLLDSKRWPERFTTPINRGWSIATSSRPTCCSDPMGWPSISGWAETARGWGRPDRSPV